MGTIDATVMRAILERDPGGGTREPTDADYKAFEKWITDTYGPEVLAQYYDKGE